ncbi:MAG: sigma-70 family RNA polymerase sigma factor [Cyclobacteriaceae bacterium]
MQPRSVKWEDKVRFTDLEVWKAFKGGSESAFIYIYEGYYDALVNYGFKFSKDKDLIQDCIQDMFVELRDRRKNLSDTDKIKPYLFKILRLKILKILQKNTKYTNIDEGFKSFDFVISYEEHLINRQLSEYQMARLQKAVSNLTTKEREAIFHFYYELHSYEQIAQIMGYSDAKVARNLVYKAVNSLRQALEADSSSFFMLTFTFL